MVRTESPLMQQQFRFEKSESGKRVLITSFFEGHEADIAIELAVEERIPVVGVVIGNSRREKHKAKKMSMCIEYNGGEMELTSP